MRRHPRRDYESEAMPGSTKAMPQPSPDDVARLLGQHYGDRSVYLREAGDRDLFELAQSIGLISADGQLTTRGYAYWQRRRGS